jgi:hypothetical protein
MEEPVKNVKLVKRSVDGRQTLFESVEAFRVPLDEWQATQEVAKHRDKVRSREQGPQRKNVAQEVRFGAARRR